MATDYSTMTQEELLDILINPPNESSYYRWKDRFSAAKLIKQETLIKLVKETDDEDIHSTAMRAIITQGYEINQPLNEMSQEKLAEVALLHEEKGKEAINYITDKNILLDIACGYKGTYNDAYMGYIKEFIYKGYNYGVSVKAAKRLDNETLINIAETHKDSDTRQVAISGITDQDILIKIIKTDECEWNRQAAMEGIEDFQTLFDLVLSDTFLNESCEYVCEIFTEKFKDKSNTVMESIIKKSANVNMRKEAIKLIKKQDIFIYAAENDENPGIRIKAINKIKDQSVLTEIAGKDENFFVRKTALKKIKDKSIAEEIIKKEEEMLKSTADNYLIFDNFNFKLAIINELMYNQKILKPAFNSDDYYDSDEKGYKIAPEAKEYFNCLRIEKTLADSVTGLYIDAPDKIYSQLWTYWDGECNTFEVKEISQKEISQFKNLKLIENEMVMNSPKAKKLQEMLKNFGIKYKW